VSSAYHELVERGWLELRRGSGLYVCAAPPPGNSIGHRVSELDRLLTNLMQAGDLLGFRQDEILDRLERRVKRRSYQRILIAEPDAAMYEILCCEIADRLAVPIGRANESDGVSEECLVVALPSRVPKMEAWLPPGIGRFPLRLRSVTSAIEGESRPPADVLIAIVSRSSEIRHWTRAMLIAAGLDIETLCDVDSSEPGWVARISSAALIVTDVVSARELPVGVPIRVFRVIADSSVAELEELFVR
jgi:hypothetical protein